MCNDIIKTKTLNDNGGVVQIQLGPGAELLSSLPLLEKVFRNCFKNNDNQIAVDMKNVKLPPARFIALLIEVTNQARRCGGSVRLFHVSDSVRNNLITFSPINYLTIEDSEQYALQDFGEKIDITPVSVPSKKNVKKARPKYAVKGPSVLTREHLLENPSNDNLPDQKIKIESRVENLYQICNFVTDLAKKAGFNSKEISKIKVTVYEACLNVVEHAYFSNPEDNWIEVTVKYDEEKFFIIIHDWGMGFDFKLSKQYDVEKAVKERKTGGFGLHIIQRSVDDINYESDQEAGNKLTLVKYLKRQGSEQIKNK